MLFRNAAAKEAHHLIADFLCNFGHEVHRLAEEGGRFPFSVHHGQQEAILYCTNEDSAYDFHVSLRHKKKILTFHCLGGSNSSRVYTIRQTVRWEHIRNATPTGPYAEVYNRDGEWTYVYGHNLDFMPQASLELMRATLLKFTDALYKEVRKQLAVKKNRKSANEKVKERREIKKENAPIKALME